MFLRSVVKYVKSYKIRDVCKLGNLKGAVNHLASDKQLRSV